VTLLRSVRVVPARELYDIDGDAITIRDLRLELDWSDDGLLTGVAGVWVVDWDVWQRIDAGRLFHLEPNLRGECFGGGLTVGLEVEIEAKLDADLVPDLAERGGGDPFVVGALFRGATSESPLAQTESWFAMFVKQAEGPLKVGFKTSWAPF